MKKLISVILFALSALSVLSASAQNTFTLRGRVVEAGSGTPIAGVAIRVEHTLRGGSTNGNGEFRIEEVAPDAVLKLSHVSCKPLTIAVDGRSELKIEMEPSFINVGQVVVTGTGTHRRLNDSPIPVTVLTGKELRESGVKTLEGALLKLDPSFSAAPLGSMGTTFTLNGLEDTYALFLLNGQRMLGSGTGAPDLSRVDLNNVKRIEILDGAASTLYGSDAIAGVVNIITDDLRSGVELSTDASVRSHGRYEHSVNLDAKEGRLGSYTSFVHQQSDGWQLNEMEEDKNGDLVRSTKMSSFAFASNAISQRFSYDLAKDLSVYAEGSYYLSDQMRPLMIGGEETSYKYDMLHQNYTYGAGLKYIVNEDISLFADFHSDNYTSQYEYIAPSGDLRVGDVETRTLTRLYEGTLKGIFNIGRFNKLSAGLSWLTDRLDDYLSTSATLAEPASSYTLSAYAQDEIRIHRKWQAVVGLRYICHEKLGSHLTPNVALMFATGPLRARAAFAMGYKTPSLADIYTFNISKDGVLTVGNEDLKPEKSTFGSLNIEYTTGRVTLSATGFFNRLRDKVEVESFEVSDEELAHYQSIYGQDVTSSIVKKRSNIDKARVAGVNIAARAYAGAGFTLAASYSYNDGKNLSAAEGEDDRLDKSIRHSGNMSAQWEHTWGRYRLNILFSGQIRGSRYSTTYSPRIGDAPRYSLWDLQTTHTFTLGKVILIPGIGIENLFDYCDDRPGYLHYVTEKGKNAATFSPSSTLTPGRTYYFSLGIRLRSK